MLPFFITGNQNKANYLSRTIGIQLEHQKLDLDEIQSSDPKKVIEHKVKQAYSLINKPVLVEDTSLGFSAIDGLPGPFIKFFVDAHNGLEIYVDCLMDSQIVQHVRQLFTDTMTVIN